MPTDLPVFRKSADVADGNPADYLYLYFTVFSFRLSNQVKIKGGPLARLCLLFARRKEPVSYTHLDVYKRQLLADDRDQGTLRR